MNTPVRIRRSKDLLGVSAVTFLTLCVAWGQNRACFVIAFASVLVGWLALCRRYPTVAWITMGFLRGLFGR
jgi:hypothetical protein